MYVLILIVAFILITIVFVISMKKDWTDYKATSVNQDKSRTNFLYSLSLISYLSGIASVLEILGFAFLFLPISDIDLRNGKVEFIKKTHGNNAQKWDDITYYTLPQNYVLESTIDTLTRGIDAPYPGVDRTNFKILGFNIQYTEALAKLFAKQLVTNKNNNKRFVDFLNYYQPNQIPSTEEDSIKFIQNHIKGRINNGYAIVYNGNFLDDIIRVNGTDYPTKIDYGNLCPPECEYFLNDILDSIHIEASKESNNNLNPYDDTKKWDMFKDTFDVHNRF